MASVLREQNEKGSVSVVHLPPVLQLVNYWPMVFARNFQVFKCIFFTCLTM